ncbi:hypothetical protein [Variovorax sp. UMC13]|uniref:hypothetical protein n=1 Tax=Variovorax sp. UMC13 TaxID=1862326 RepID=UPI001C7FFC2C|nr:hypothetical protein [Variovorax sp. UMC13]
MLPDAAAPRGDWPVRHLQDPGSKDQACPAETAIVERFAAFTRRAARPGKPCKAFGAASLRAAAVASFAGEFAAPFTGV